MGKNHLGIKNVVVSSAIIIAFFSYPDVLNGSVPFF